MKIFSETPVYGEWVDRPEHFHSSKTSRILKRMREVTQFYRRCRLVDPLREFKLVVRRSSVSAIGDTQFRHSRLFYTSLLWSPFYTSLELLARAGRAGRDAHGN